MINKKKKWIIVAMLFIIITIIVSIFVAKKIVNKDKTSNINKQNDSNEYNIIEENKAKEIPTVPFDKEKYDKDIKYLAENEMNGIEEKPIIIIKDENNNEYIITDKDIEMYKYLGSREEEPEEKIKKYMIEYKICYIEAQKLGITLPKRQLDEIEKLSNLESNLKYLQNNENAKNKYIERKRNYFLQLDYRKEIICKITDEITENKISIDDVNVNEKMKEYNKNIENFLKIKEPTEEQRTEAAKKSISLTNKIIDLYLKAIESKYVVEYK